MAVLNVDTLIREVQQIRENMDTVKAQVLRERAYIDSDIDRISSVFQSEADSQALIMTLDHARTELITAQSVLETAEMTLGHVITALRQ